MGNRRKFLKLLAGSALAAMLPVAWFTRGLRPVRRYGTFYVVNGWLVTARDLEAVERHDA
jgi:hypothetical protein